MNAWAWVLVGAYALSGLATVARIGKPRGAITSLEAVIQLVLNAGFTFIVFKAATA